MKHDLRVVIDTNVIVSGLLSKKDSPSSQILGSIRSQEIVLVASPAIIEEIANVISRDRIIKLTQMSHAKQSDFIDELISRTEITAGQQLQSQGSRDIRDDIFLACALEANVDYLVTGDEDLLVLKEFKNIKIVTPRQFLTIQSQKKA